MGNVENVVAEQAEGWAKAKEMGSELIDYGVELSKQAGFQPDAAEPVEAQAQAILKDAIPRLMSWAKAEGLL